MATKGSRKGNPSYSGATLDTTTSDVKRDDLKPPPEPIGRVLFVATSQDAFADNDAKPAGARLDEIATLYLALQDANYAVEFASPGGGAIPLDPTSALGDALTPDAARFAGNPDAMHALEGSKHVEDISSADSYDAIFIPGGHGIMFDGPDNNHLQKLLADFSAKGRVVSAVGHGPAALTGAKLQDGSWLVHGRKVTGFSNSEERAAGKDKDVPFLLEDKLKEQGASYSAAADGKPHVVTDGKLVTGQNPASSKGVAEAVIRAVKQQK